MAMECSLFHLNIRLSLAEIDKGMIYFYPELVKHKPVLLRAYKKSSGDDGFVQEEEFGQLLFFLAYYEHLYKEFEKMDDNGDRRLSFDEFKKAYKTVGIIATESQLRETFDEIDADHGGMVLFEEFCKYMAKKRLDGLDKQNDTALKSAPKEDFTNNEKGRNMSSRENANSSTESVHILMNSSLNRSKESPMQNKKKTISVVQEEKAMAKKNSTESLEKSGVQKKLLQSKEKLNSGNSQQKLTSSSSQIKKEVSSSAVTNENLPQISIYSKLDPATFQKIFTTFNSEDINS
jgi:hypothetical protein